MPDLYSRGPKNNRNPDGSWTGRGDPSEGLTRKADLTPEEVAERGREFGESVADTKGKLDDYGESFKKWSDKKDAYRKVSGGALVPYGKVPKLPYGKKPVPWSIAGEVAWWILNPPVSPDTGSPDWELPLPDVPPQPVRGDQTSICGMEPIRVHGKWLPGMPRSLNQWRIRSKLFLQRQYPSFGDRGIVKAFDTTPVGGGFERFDGIAGQKAGGTRDEGTFTRTWIYRKYWCQVVGTIPYTKQRWVSSVNSRKASPEWDGYSNVQWINGNGPPVGGADAGLDNYFPVAELECSIEIIYDEEDTPPPVDPNQYDRENDEEQMACKWQRDEISYQLPELKIGDKEIGGSTIQIDDGLKPLAEYLCKAIELLHNGLGLNLLDDKEFPVNLANASGPKVKPNSLAALQHWQFEQVASLVGLPVKNTLTNLESETKDLQFKNIQDCLSYIVHQQRESDLDLMVLEQYSTRIAQQLEAVTQIALRQHSDIEMIVKEMGFKYITKTEKRPCLYKTGMKDDDEKTGIIELFKGGEVSYPVRIWKDDLDQRQIAMKTNLYAEIAARAFLQPTNTDGDVQGLDARVKMGKSKGEDWLEWVKTINTPENGVVSGSSTPFIEEYTKGTVAAKSIKAPTSGLSLFMKQPKVGKK